MKVSIIMPVYNAAATLQHSLGSLLKQDFRDFEIVAVDDCSSDNSAEILKSFCDRNGIALNLIRHEHNRGVAAARNTALDAAAGEYICWLDADDALADGALSEWVKTADDNQWEITGCEWYMTKAKSERYMAQAPFDTPEQALKNMMAGVMRWNLWLFLIRREAIGGLRFIEGLNMGEDMSFMCQLMMKTDNVGLIKEGLYHYWQNEKSVSRSFSEANISQVTANVELMSEALRKSRYSSLGNPYVDWLKLNIKLPLLVTGRKSDYRRWRQWWPECNQAASSNKTLPARTRLLQMAAAKGLWPIVWLYTFLLNKIYYGIIYR
ncbi:MAG: glycosyltransferase [Bacteroidales bacterium]|nr:glycosyltransferase [Bacteroidales bacterium]